MSTYRVPTFIDDIDEMLIKKYHNAFIPNNIFSSVIPKDVFVQENIQGNVENNKLECDKKSKDIMIDYFNRHLSKLALKTSIHKDIFAFKDAYRISYFDQIWAQKDSKELLLHIDINALKNDYTMSIYDNIIAKLDSSSIILHKDLFTDRKTKICYYYYDEWAIREKLKIALHEDLFNIKENGIRLFDMTTAISNKDSIELYEPIVSSMAPIRNLSIIEISQIEKLRKEIEIFANDYGNWAWVYETPDPFKTDSFGIDELLLPENDTRYSDFKDIIFDKDSMTPRNPVKMINNTTFIARYPIDLPIEEYADIGKIYEDSAEKWKNYFGIETEVMHDIFLKYYQIWQSKIFEFATMTMIQSTKKMLDLLYTWITMYYPIEKMEQALRVFRQIRWYSESAVIRNSEYIISYEYDTLKSNLHTGKCDIPNNLDSNPTMIIDNNLNVIKNNPAYIGQEAYVEFEIDAKKNTTFSFSLNNKVGTVKVYLNNVLIEMLPKSVINHTIYLPYTGTTNYVKILKEANHNVDKYFYIGNIIVPDAGFKDLSIEFNPVLREGNKPINEVAKKLIAFANLYADRNEMYAIARRANVGITETYKKMNEYWKNHHQDKTKGKRLTIKQI